MPVNPEAPITRAQTASAFVARHNEAVCLTIGFLAGAIVTLLGVLVG